MEDFPLIGAYRDMLEYQKKHSHLICMDSDGTVMDTMTLKHKRCFGPCFLIVFGITHHKKEILEYWLDINLYKPSRGVNRFVGLDMILSFVQKYGYTYIGSDAYHEWVNCTREYSVSSIREYMKTSIQDTFLLALKWSALVNNQIAKLPPSTAFSGVVDVIKEASRFCDLLGVSSANPQAVYEEWSRLNLMQYFQFVGCQDKGNKESLIQQAMEKKYEYCIMVGDAIGDLEAALANHIYFFPILPKKEESSWRRFRTEALPRFIKNQFTKEYQQQLIDEFILFLKGGQINEVNI